MEIMGKIIRGKGFFSIVVVVTFLLPTPNRAEPADRATSAIQSRPVKLASPVTKAVPLYDPIPVPYCNVSFDTPEQYSEMESEVT